MTPMNPFLRYAAEVRRLSGETLRTSYQATQKVAVGDTITIDGIVCHVTKVVDPRPKARPGSLEADEVLIGR
jgi:hypothetical protein